MAEEERKLKEHTVSTGEAATTVEGLRAQNDALRKELESKEHRCQGHMEEMQNLKLSKKQMLERIWKLNN